MMKTSTVVEQNTGTSCISDDEIFWPEVSVWPFVAYLLIGAAWMFAVQWIAIHLCGVRLMAIRFEPWEPLISDQTAQLMMLCWDLGAAFFAFWLVMATWGVFDDEIGTRNVIRADTHDPSRFSARFRLTLLFSSAYGLSFGGGEVVVNWLCLHDAAIITALPVCFGGVAIGVHHVSTLANWNVIKRCKAAYKKTS
jgi:hypothetical protein